MNKREEFLLAIAKMSANFEVLELDTRAYNILHRHGYTTVADIFMLLYDDKLKKFRGMGEKTKYEVEFQLKKYLGDTFNDMMPEEKDE